MSSLLNHHRPTARPAPGPTSGAVSGVPLEPLVLIHGIGSLWQFWAPVLPPLAARLDVHAIDLPGFGLSPCLPEGVTPDAAALADAVEAYLVAQGIHGAAHVCGHSLGGWVALELGRRGACRSVTAIAPGGIWTPFEQRAAAALLRTAHVAARRLEPFAPALLSTRPGRTLALAGIMGRPWRCPPGVALAWTRAFAAAPGFGATLEALSAPGVAFRGAGELRCPVTLAWGTRDIVLPLHQMRRLVDAVPHARAFTLTGAGHAPIHDDTAGVLRVILDGASSRIAR